MATELKHIVSPTGGDGLTSLQAAINHIKASHANLVTADVYAVIEIQGTWSSADTTAVIITGITTDATRYLRIQTDASNRAGTAWSDTKYRLVTSDSGALSINPSSTQTQHVIVDGLQISNTDPTANQRNLIAFGGSTQASGNWYRIANCLLKGHGGTTYYQRGISAAPYVTPVADISVWNTIIYGLGTAADNTAIYGGNGSAFAVYNCVGIASLGLRKDGAASFTVANCYASKYVGSPTLTTCASIDTSGSVGLQSIANDTTEGAGHAGFAAMGDFALKSGSVLKDAGTSDPSSGLYSTDIVGTSRPQGAAWDIGAFEYVAAGGPTGTLVLAAGPFA